MSNSGSVLRQPGFASMLGKLLRLRARILINGFRRAKLRTKLAYILGPLAISLFLLALSTGILAFVRSPFFAQHVGNAEPFLVSVPAVIFTLAGLGIIVTSFGVMLQTLYLSGDMDFLMSTPVPIHVVFMSKLIQAVMPNFVILALITIPPLFGLGISGGYNLLYYPGVVFMLIAITLSAVSISGVLVMVVARFIQPRRVAEVFGFLLGLAIFISSQSNHLFSGGVGHISERKAAQFTQLLGRFNQPWSPMAWAGRGIIDLGKGEWFAAAGLLAAPLALTAILFLAALICSEWMYYTGWASIQARHRTPHDKVRSRVAAVSVPSKRKRRLASLVPAQVTAIVWKDLRLCVRDLSNLTGLLFPLILGIIYGVGLVRSNWKMPPGRGTAPAEVMQAGNALFLYADIALALFLGWSIVSTLAGLSFTREGKDYWMLKAAPISARRLLAAKFLVSYIPSAILCSVFVLALQILKRVDFFTILVSLISIWMLLAGLSGIYLALGTRGAKFDWENPAQRNRSIGCMGMLAGLIFLGICFALFIGPAILANVFHYPVISGRLMGLLLGGIANALAVIVPLAMVEKRVSILNET